jgi:hypothetical protein
MIIINKPGMTPQTFMGLYFIHNHFFFRGFLSESKNYSRPCKIFFIYLSILGPFCFLSSPMKLENLFG